MIYMKSKEHTQQTTWNAARAKELVKLSGFTREHVAKEVGIEPGSLNNILNGTVPSLPVVKLLAHVLGCKESEFWASDGQEAS